MLPAIGGSLGCGARRTACPDDQFLTLASLAFSRDSTVRQSLLAFAAAIWSSTPPAVPPGRGPCDGSGRGVSGPDGAQCGFWVSRVSSAAGVAGRPALPSGLPEMCALRGGTP